MIIFCHSKISLLVSAGQVLIYKVDTGRCCVMLYLTGTHSDLFR